MSNNENHGSEPGKASSLSDASLEVVVVKQSIEKKSEKIVSGRRSKTPKESVGDTNALKSSRKSSRKQKTSKLKDEPERRKKKSVEIDEASVRKTKKSSLDKDEKKIQGDKDVTDTTSQDTVERVTVTAMVHKNEASETPKSKEESKEDREESKEKIETDRLLAEADEMQENLIKKTVDLNIKDNCEQKDNLGQKDNLEEKDSSEQKDDLEKKDNIGKEDELKKKENIGKEDELEKESHVQVKDQGDKPKKETFKNDERGSEESSQQTLKSETNSETSSKAQADSSEKADISNLENKSISKNEFSEKKADKKPKTEVHFKDEESEIIASDKGLVTELTVPTKNEFGIEENEKATKSETDSSRTKNSDAANQEASDNTKSRRTRKLIKKSDRDESEEVQKDKKNDRKEKSSKAREVDAKQTSDIRKETPDGYVSQSPTKTDKSSENLQSSSEKSEKDQLDVDSARGKSEGVSSNSESPELSKADQSEKPEIKSKNSFFNKIEYS